jgi:hypothetical protein
MLTHLTTIEIDGMIVSARPPTKTQQKPLKMKKMYPKSQDLKSAHVAPASVTFYSMIINLININIAPDPPSQTGFVYLYHAILFKKKLIFVLCACLQARN